MKKQIAITIILLLGIAVSVFLSQRQQILKSRASLQIYNAFNVASGEPGKYVSCTGNVCETNSLNITISVADLQALNIQEQVAAAKTLQQCQQELGEPPPFCDASSCVKNTAIADNNQCSFKLETVDLSLCPNNCQSDGTQTILCREAETCQKYNSGQLTGKLIKYWINEIGGIEGCQAPQESEDNVKCPTGQTLATGQYTAVGGGLTGQVNAGTAPIPFCSAQDFATPCWMGADCKEENQTYADKACSNNHVAGSVCTRSTGASNVFDDGCTKTVANVAVDSCSVQYYVTACWQGADCKEENQASANSVCSQNHGQDSVCTRATGMGNVYEDGCTYGTSGQLAAGIKEQCTSEAFATSCWIEARCDETNQRFADRTCVNNHGEGSACTRSTGTANTNDDGCTKTVLDVAQARRAIAAKDPTCFPIESCDEEISERIIADSCGKIPETGVFDASCRRPDLSPEQAMDLYWESKKQAALAKKQEAEKQDKPFWEKAGDLAGGLWNGIISLGKGIQDAPKQSEVGPAIFLTLKRQIDTLFAEGQRNAKLDQELLEKLQECQKNYLQAAREGRVPEEDCSAIVPQIPQKRVEEKAAEAEACALESGDVKTCLSKVGVNMDVNEAKIEKVGICLIPTLNLVDRCYGPTWDVTVPADSSQDLSAVLRKAEVVKLAEKLGLKLDEDPNFWEKEKREFFFNAAARTDINAGKFVAEFFGIPITAWENANAAARICARDFNKLCFTNSEAIPMGAVMSLRTNEDFEKINQIAQSLYRGFVPASNDETKKLADLITRYGSTNNAYFSLKPEQLPKPSDIPQEEWDRIIRTAKVYAQVGDYVKNNTVAGRLYNEKQSEAIVETYIGLVSTVVDPFPAAQALSSGLKYVIVKQAYKRLSDRFESKVASEIAQNAEKAIARGAVATAAERNAIEALAEAAGLPPMSNPADQIRIMVDNDVVEPPLAVSALRNAIDGPEMQRTAAEAIPTYHNGSEKLGDPAVVASPADAHFVEPQVPSKNPFQAIAGGVDNLVHPPEAPVTGVRQLVDVAGSLDGAEAKLLGEVQIPTPAKDMLTDGADVISSGLDGLAGHPCPAGSAGVQCKITANTVPSIGHPERNEDAVFYDAQKGVAMVLDGVGGHGGGDKASSTAQKFLAEAIGTIDDTNPQIVEEKMRQALIDASEQVYRETSPEFKEIGMRTRQYPGTTASVVKVVEHDGQQVAVIGNVGDSRVYRFRNGRLEQLTKDDDAFFSEKISREISEAQRRSDLNPDAQEKWDVRNRIGQMLGGTSTPDPRMTVVPLKPGDRIILTSDGVHDNLTRTEIENIVKNNQQNPSQELMERALARSKDTSHFRYKKDDITAAVVDIPSDKASSPLQQAARGIQSTWENLRSVVSPQKVATPVSKEIKEAQSWEEFFRLLDAKGQVIGSDGTVYTASQIKKTALAVKSGEVELENLTRSDGVRETAERLRNAPCPIFSLIPVALAQEGGGLTPCPKNPLAALARNAGNAARQFLDRFNAPKPESALDKLVPATASEKTMLNRAKIVEAVTDKDISLLNKAGAEVAQQAQKYDYVIVSGQSADIAKTILIKQGVSENKIIKFSVDDNAHVYKIVEGQAIQLTEAERNSLTRDALVGKGVNLTGDKKPTFLIVDDISDTGYKATAYLDRFSQIEGVGETQYAALSVLRGAVIDPSVAGTGNFANFSREKLEQLAQQTFTPSKLTTAEKSRITYVMDNLSGVLEGNTLKNDTISYNVLVNSRITARKMLERISQQKPNPVRAVLDNVTSAVQNTGRQVLDKVGLRKSAGEQFVDQQIKQSVEISSNTIKQAYPEGQFSVFSSYGSSAVLYESKDAPGMVYKTYINYPEGTFSEDGLKRKIEVERYAQKEAKNLTVLSDEGLSPRLIEYTPTALTDEERRLLEDPSFGFWAKEYGLQKDISLPLTARMADAPIVVMEKIDVDPQGVLRMVADPQRKQVEIDRITAILEKHQFYLGDAEAVMDKNGRLWLIDAAGIGPYLPDEFPTASIRKGVEDFIDYEISIAQRKQAQRGLVQKAQDTVGGTWNGFINGAVDLVTESTLGWVQKTKPRFNIYQELAGRKGPFVELAGPTDVGFEMVNVYERGGKFYVAQADGIKRGADKELITSNLRPEGVSIKYPGCEPFNYGPVSFQADATRVPLRNSSAGAIFVSCLPKGVRQETIKQSYDALEDGGLLIWQGGVREDIEVAERAGFQVVSFVKYNAEDPGGIKSDEYRVIFQKTGLGGLEAEQVLGKTPLQKAKDTVGGWVDNFKGIFRKGGKQEVVVPKVTVEPGDVVAARLTNVETRSLKVGDRELVVRFGYDPKYKETSTQGLTYLIEPGQTLPLNVKIINKTGQVVDLTQAKKPIGFAEIDKIVVDEKEYWPVKDAWLNPNLLPILEPKLPNPQFVPVLKQVLEVWDTAINDPSRIEHCLQNCLALPVYQKVKRVVDYIENNPDLSKLYVQVNPWELANMTSSERERIYKGLGGFQETPLFAKLEELVERIKTGQLLGDNERVLAEVLEFAHILNKPSINEAGGLNRITEINRQYSMANLAQDFLIRDLMPEDVVRVHQTNFREFQDLLKRNGIELPDWFTSFSGSEFRYGIQLDGTLANAGGEIFLGPKIWNAEEMADVLTHERIHALEFTAIKLTGVYPEPEGFRSNEVFTDALARLITHNGNVEAALADKSLYETGYFSGVYELLKIVTEINNYSTDSFQGTNLLVHGILGQKSGRIRNLAPIEEYYDRFIAGNGETFAQRMAAYDDRKLIVFWSIPKPVEEKSYSAIEQIARNLSSAGQIREFDVQFYIENPMILLSSSGTEDSAGRKIFQGVISDEKARQEMQEIVDEYYRNYAKALQTKLDELAEKAVVPPVAISKEAPKTIFDNVGDTVKNWFNGIFNAGKKQSLSLEVAWT